MKQNTNYGAAAQEEGANQPLEFPVEDEDIDEKRTLLRMRAPI